MPVLVGPNYACLGLSWVCLFGLGWSCLSGLVWVGPGLKLASC